MNGLGGIVVALLVLLLSVLIVGISALITGASAGVVLGAIAYLLHLVGPVSIGTVEATFIVGFALGGLLGGARALVAGLTASNQPSGTHIN